MGPEETSLAKITSDETQAVNPLDSAIPKTAEYDRSYANAIENLGYYFSSIDYNSEGNQVESREEKIANLIQDIKSGTFGSIAESNSLFRNYVKGYSKTEEQSRYAISIDDPDFKAFLNSGVVLESLAELSLLKNIRDGSLDAVILETAGKWYELAEKVFKLDDKASKNGMNLDHDEVYEEESRRQDAEIKAYEAAEETRREAQRQQELEAYYDAQDDGRFGDPRDIEEEIYEVEDVANWIGPNGTWT